MGKKEIVVERELTSEEKWIRGACSGDQEMIDTLLNSNPDLINKQDQLGVTALVSKNHIRIFTVW